MWPKPAAPSKGEMSFEDMMARYKTRSEEKNRRPQARERRTIAVDIPPPRLVGRRNHSTNGPLS